MNRISLLTFFLLISLLTTAQVQKFSRGHEYCHAKKIQNELSGMSKQFSPNAPAHSFDVLDYSMELDLMNNYSSPYPRNFQGNIVIQFRIDTALNAIELNANNLSLTIDSVGMAASAFTHSNNLLNISLDRTYLPGEIAMIKIYYQHNNVEDNAVYVSGGFLFTDCEPEGARKWFPCYDHPSDKATVSVKAKVPANVKLASNGRLQDSIPGTNSITYHWISRDPVATYLVILTSKVNYKLDIVYWTNPNTNEVVPMRFYYNNNENPGPMEAIIGDMTTFFSHEFGDHPFEKNGFATLNNQFAWGGMENQTLTSLCPDCWDEWLVAHEFAHQWFGDMITCATWADIFLNEGFATWTEAHWTENVSGYSAYKNEIDGNASYYLSANPGWAISNPDWAVNTPSSNTLFNYAITYMKGSCVLHQLRYVLGDSLYFAGIKAYATDTVDFKYKSATIGDFKTKMETVTEQELDWFFDAWIYKPNHPSYKNVYSFKPLQDGKWQVTFTARQQQASLYYWQMPIELRISFMNLTDTIIRVFNSYNNQIFTFEFDQQPANLQFDPHNDIVLKQASTIVSIDEPEAQNPGISVFPTQFDSQVIIRYSLDQPSNSNITVTDPMGKVVFQKSLPRQSAGIHEFEWDGSTLPSGFYFLNFSSGNQVKSFKIIRQ